jgi:D-alanyl-D-alanine carboxypeptidase/D-alanyl-D-alanine-endopeptidase (penicillin-binding protein 4)
MLRLPTFVLVSLFLYSCSAVSKRSLDKTLQLTEQKFQDHAGFILYDPEEKKVLYEYNANKYFTPASNTKIFTFYTSLKIIGDSIPAFKYLINGDSLIFWGTGDPSFLYKNVSSSNRAYNFLTTTNQRLYLSTSNFQTERFGPGWAWDDYNDYYSAERSSFPIYGNIITISEQVEGLKIQPSFFNTFVEHQSANEKSSFIRELHSNKVLYSPGAQVKKLSKDIPFKIYDTLVSSLIADTLQKPVALINRKLSTETKLFYSVPADSLYKVMMQQSDNFIAEQLLLICSGILSDTLKPEIAINYAKKNLLSEFKDEPIWKDGSGLSRYNLFTPRSIVQLWEMIYKLVPQQRLFSLLATGGKGTMRTAYKADVPYIYGKTGTLSNNHNLSGYLVTKKGKVLIFAFMNNNYVTTTSSIRKNMEEVLINIREHY